MRVTITVSKSDLEAWASEHPGTKLELARDAIRLNFVGGDLIDAEGLPAHVPASELRALVGDVATGLEGWPEAAPAGFVGVKE